MEDRHKRFPVAMSTNPDGKPIQPTYAQHHQSAGNLYSFSVHQPYTNWPLHGSHNAPYTPSWYSHPPHATQPYMPHKTYRDQGAQTQEGSSKGNEQDSCRHSMKFAKQWDAAFSAFLRRVGLQQTLAGFREDMLLLNEDWEREQIPNALQALAKDISELAEGDDTALPKKGLGERKLEYIPPQPGVELQTASSTVKSVSRLLKESRKRNDASNRAEFLLSIAEKRRRLSELGESSSTTLGESEILPHQHSEAGRMEVDTTVASCARADAKFQDRDVQMKYDIAKNEDGPLKRTMKRMQADGDSSSSSRAIQTPLPMLRDGSREPEARSHPGLAARMEAIEDHLGVRFVPSRPRSLLDRLKFLEDYIIRLEKDYPPWAALHFSQPKRGWPAPPRSTPIIVPSHLASPDSSSYPSTCADAIVTGQARSVGSIYGSQPSSSKSTSGSKVKPGKSSLHRAVMEKLEVKRAIVDLAGTDLGGTGTSA